MTAGNDNCHGATYCPIPNRNQAAQHGACQAREGSQVKTPQGLIRYQVTAVVLDSGRYETRLLARNPVAAATRVMRRLGLEQTPSSPFLLAVWPVVQGHG